MESAAVHSSAVDWSDCNHVEPAVVAAAHNTAEGKAGRRLADCTADTVISHAADHTQNQIEDGWNTGVEDPHQIDHRDESRSRLCYRRKGRERQLAS